MGRLLEWADFSWRGFLDIIKSGSIALCISTFSTTGFAVWEKRSFIILTRSLLVWKHIYLFTIIFPYLYSAWPRVVALLIIRGEESNNYWISDLLSYFKIDFDVLCLNNFSDGEFTLAGKRLFHFQVLVYGSYPSYLLASNLNYCPKYDLHSTE